MNETLSHLTPRETEVAELVLNGDTNNQIALKKNLSPKTVKFHLTKIYKKCEVINRSQFIVKYLRGFIYKATVTEAHAA